MRSWTATWLAMMSRWGRCVRQPGDGCPGAASCAVDDTPRLRSRRPMRELPRPRADPLSPTVDGAGPCRCCMQQTRRLEAYTWRRPPRRGGFVAAASAAPVLSHSPHAHAHTHVCTHAHARTHTHKRTSTSISTHALAHAHALTLPPPVCALSPVIQLPRRRRRPCSATEASVRLLLRLSERTPFRRLHASSHVDDVAGGVAGPVGSVCAVDVRRLCRRRRTVRRASYCALDPAGVATIRVAHYCLRE